MPTTLWNRSFNRFLKKITKTATRAGSKLIVKALRTVPTTRKSKLTNARSTSMANWSAGIAISAAGSRRYRLYKPPNVLRSESLPLMVMLHGCGQDADAFAASTNMNRIAASKRFFVLYPEQDVLSNAQGCWNWYDTRSGRSQREAATIDHAIDQICLLQPIDQDRIVLAGLSAGASMAALLALRRPERFRAIAMHSGVGPGVAHSLASAIMAMRGTKVTSKPLPIDLQLPPLLVIHGSTDRVVAPINGVETVRLWAAPSNAKASKPRTIRRGARYPVTMTDYRNSKQLVATICEVNGLGHAWSGGAAGHSYSDPKGPDASAMIWTFVAKQFF